LIISIIFVCPECVFGVDSIRLNIRTMKDKDLIISIIFVCPECVFGVDSIRLISTTMKDKVLLKKLLIQARFKRPFNKSFSPAN
jgi:uncharacterized protein YbbK (DUF523 family)